MNTVRMILCGNVEDSRMNPSENVGVVSVVFVSVSIILIFNYYLLIRKQSIREWRQEDSYLHSIFTCLC